jgi:quercetin dioxygenase-like cupin family protein
MAPIEHLTTPPGKPSQPYVLPCYTGELWTIPTSNSTMRLLVTGKETDNDFAVVGTGGTFDKPIGFHFHKEAHDVFLCIKGKINVWANDQARSLSPGDFASVPPVCIHLRFTKYARWLIML